MAVVISNASPLIVCRHFGNSLPAIALRLGACALTRIEAEMRRLNLPKWTKTEYKKLHEEIASLALQLCELTTKVDTPIGTPADLWLLVALQERESC